MPTYKRKLKTRNRDFNATNRQKNGCALRNPIAIAGRNPKPDPDSYRGTKRQTPFFIPYSFSIFKNGTNANVGIAHIITKIKN